MFFIFFEKIYTNPFVEKAFYLVCGEKLITDGYCDMNRYISGKISKDSMLQILKNIDSPFTELYRSKFVEAKDIEKTLDEFINSKAMKNYGNVDFMKFEEAQALINWIYKSINTMEERLVATKEMMKSLKEKYKLSSEVNISQGIVYLNSKVELNFLSSIEEFFKYIREMSLPGKTLFYRGHAEANYILIPSLMRRHNWRINERKMYNELIIKCPSSFEKMKSHLEYLVEMQHYGLPTRLLDITTNPLVALYFACENYQDSFGEIVVFSVDDNSIKYPQSDTVSILASLPMFDYEKQQEMYECASDKNMSQEQFNIKVHRLLHEVKSEKPAFRDEIEKNDLLSSVVVLPLKNNNRVLKQDGAFILCGLSKNYKELDLNELRYKDSNEKRQVFIIKEKKSFIDMLNAFSINKSTLFPEIDDVADFIKGRY